MFFFFQDFASELRDRKRLEKSIIFNEKMSPKMMVFSV